MTPLFRIRVWLIIFLAGLVASGVTAFPLVSEVRLLDSVVDLPWIGRVRAGLEAVDRDQPFMFYGTDWLAFAHIVIGLAFIGPLRDPVRNVWVVRWAMLCCVAVVPLALIAGPIRGIPCGIPLWRPALVRPEGDQKVSRPAASMCYRAGHVFRFFRASAVTLCVQGEFARSGAGHSARLGPLYRAGPAAGHGPRGATGLST